MRKIGRMLLGITACFAVALCVSAASYQTLGYQEYHRITVDSMGTSFTTKTIVSSVNNTPTIQTQVGRKMFNLVWYDSGSVTNAYTGATTRITTWSANGTYATRATWTNVTSDSSVTAAFSLY